VWEGDDQEQELSCEAYSQRAASDMWGGRFWQEQTIIPRAANGPVWSDRRSAAFSLSSSQTGQSPVGPTLAVAMRAQLWSSNLTDDE